MALIILIDNSNDLQLKTLTNRNTGAAITDATVVVTLKDDAGTTVTGGNTFPATLAHDTGGTYSVTLQSTLALTEGDVYWAEITATSGTLIGNWRIPLRAIKRRS